MVKDFSKYALFTVLNLLIGYGLLWFLANQLTKAEYAQFGWYTTLFAIAVIFMNIGHRDALFKLASQRSPSLGRFLTTAIICLSLSLLLLPVISYFDTPLLLVSGAGFVLLHLLNVVSAVHRGEGRYQQDALAVPIYRALWLCGCVVIVGLAHKLTVMQVFTVAMVSAGLAFVLVGGVQTVKRLADFNKLSFPLANPTIRHFFLIELVTIFFIKIDLPLLKLFNADSNTISDYFFAFQMFEAGILLLAPIGFLFFNQINQQVHAKEKRQTAMKALLMIVTLILLGNVGWRVFGEWFLTLLFPKYLSSYALISLFVGILLPNALNMLLAQSLFSIHQEAIVIRVVTIGIVVLLGCNVLLQPYLLLNTVIWSRLIAECIILLLLFLACYKQRHLIFSS